MVSFTTNSPCVINALKKKYFHVTVLILRHDINLTLECKYVAYMYLFGFYHNFLYDVILTSFILSTLIIL